MVSWSGVSRYSKSSGTGRCSELTSATSIPVRSWICSPIEETSPRVADIRRNRVCGSVISGICQATPRSGSE